MMKNLIIIFFVLIFGCNGAKDDSIVKIKLSLKGLEKDFPEKYKRQNLELEKNSNGEIISIFFRDYKGFEVPDELSQINSLEYVAFDNCDFGNEKSLKSNSSIKKVFFSSCQVKSPIKIVENCKSLNFLAIKSTENDLITLDINNIPNSLDTLYLQSNRIKKIKLDTILSLKALIVHEQFIESQSFLEFLPNLKYNSLIYSDSL